MGIKMKVLAINGSPRKIWNTATLLKKALEGAGSKGAETELIHLYDYNFKGCTSCFACKLKGGKSYGHCGFKDELSPILDRIPQVDALILGSPIYLGSITGEMKSFLERLIFPYYVYGSSETLFPKKIPVVFIYTAGASEAQLKYMNVEQQIKFNEMFLGRLFGHAESFLSTDTFQFDDYSKYVQEFNVEEKTKKRQEVFPIDCQKVFEIGATLARLKPI
jgi:multimeric flavodoxin WrbA